MDDIFSVIRSMTPPQKLYFSSLCYGDGSYPPYGKWRINTCLEHPNSQYYKNSNKPYHQISRPQTDGTQYRRTDPHIIVILEPGQGKKHFTPISQKYSSITTLWTFRHLLVKYVRPRVIHDQSNHNNNNNDKSNNGTVEFNINRV